MLEWRNSTPRLQSKKNENIKHFISSSGNRVQNLSRTVTHLCPDAMTGLSSQLLYQLNLYMVVPISDKQKGCFKCSSLRVYATNGVCSVPDCSIFPSNLYLLDAFNRILLVPSGTALYLTFYLKRTLNTLDCVESYVRITFKL